MAVITTQGHKPSRPANLAVFLVCFCLSLFLPNGQDLAHASPSSPASAGKAETKVSQAGSASSSKKAAAASRARPQPRQIRPDPSKPAPTSVATRSFIHKDERCSVMVNYPQVGNSKIDSELDFWARQTVRTFVDGVGSLEVGQGGRFSMLVDYEISEPSEEFLSIVFRVTTETGGAHPDPGMVTFSYDLSDGRRLSIQDIFGDPAGLLQFLSIYSYERLLAELGQNFENSIKNGTSPDFLNFSLFALTSDGLTLYFPPYQVADYAHGEKNVKVASDKLAPYKPRRGVWPDDGLRSGLVRLGGAGSDKTVKQ